MNHPRQKCPVCGYDILKEKRFRTGVSCFLSVHSECTSCGASVVCGFTPGGEYIIVTHEEYERLSNAAREKGNSTI